MKINKNKFENYLCERNDEIDNAAYNLACTLAQMPEGTELEWDMSYIGEIVSETEDILKNHNIPTCHPSYTSDDNTDEIPCPVEHTCGISNCPFANKKQ